MSAKSPTQLSLADSAVKVGAGDEWPCKVCGGGPGGHYEHCQAAAAPDSKVDVGREGLDLLREYRREHDYEHGCDGDPCDKCKGANKLLAAASAVHVQKPYWEELRVSVEALLKWKHEYGGMRDTDGSREQIKVVERALAALVK